MSDPSPFDSLDDYVAVPRLTGLVLSPDGSRLVATVQSLSTDRRRYRTALWEIDRDGGGSRCLTRSEAGEAAGVFLPEGDLLFVSKRPAPLSAGEETDGGEEANGVEKVAGVWRLPASGGEAELVATRPGGVSRVLVARDAGTPVVVAPALAGPAETDAERRKARREAAVSAVLHDGLPVRHWDHDLGPARDRLFAVDGRDDEGRWRLRDLTPQAGGALEEVSTVVSADGSRVFTGWRVSHDGGRESARLVAIDVASGEHRVVAAADDEAAGQHDFDHPAVAPDGSWVAFVDTRTESVERAPSVTLALVDLATDLATDPATDPASDLAADERRDLLPDFALWPSSPVAAADSSAVYFVADEAGHAPIWRVEVGSGALTRLTRTGAYSDLCPSPDGRFVYALRAAVDSPSRPVRLEATGADQEPVVLDAPGAIHSVPGRLEQIEAVGSDGARLRAYLVLPDAEDPAPLLLWVHGGPLMSWNSWSWRWNPWLMVAKGWAVLLPDPGLSQGYGDEFVQRAWGSWGPVPFDDLMAITDAAERRHDVDGTRTAAMGGSYGGYMANWIAGHTDRFKAIVSHASLWTLDRFAATTDHPGSWALEWGHPDEAPELYERNSPHRHASSITTPMLVVHGDRDYRVPIGEGLHLVADLVRHGVDAKFLYFPDEGHWVLQPGNVKIWYETVQAFLDHHVLGADWVRPALV